jgi:hypothetical protein
MSHQIERILYALIVLILIAVLTSGTTRIKLEAWDIRLDIFTTDSQKEQSIEGSNPLRLAEQALLRTPGMVQSDPL